MQSEELNQSEENEERDQSTENPRISNDRTGMDRLEMSFDEKYICTWTTSPIIEDGIEI